MSDVEYFAHPYLNNSGLTKMQNAYPGNQSVFDFGTLVHACIMEMHRVNMIKNTCGHIYFTQDVLTRALLMKAAFMADPFCAGLLKSCRKEVEMYNPNTPFEFLGQRFAIDTKRKYDLWNDAAGWGGDIKTTAATTQAGFEMAIKHYEYDRGRVFYAKGSGATKDVIIGISKVNYKIFPVFMYQGCPLWTSGEAKLNALAYQYWKLNPPF